MSNYQELLEKIVELENFVRNKQGCKFEVLFIGEKHMSPLAYYESLKIRKAELVEEEERKATKKKRKEPLEHYVAIGSDPVRTRLVVEDNVNNCVVKLFY